MATIQKFEDIEAWKEARLLTSGVYKLCKAKALASDFGLVDQIRRASVSIMSNIAEGFGRGGNKEFLQFLAHARGSASEVKSLLYVLLDAEYIDQSTFDRFHAQTSKTEALLSRFIAYLRQSEIKGSKFKK